MSLRSGLSLGAVLAFVACAQDGLKTIPTPPAPPLDESSTPVAIADFAAATDPSSIAPLDRVTLDGRDSYDPRDAGDRSLITDYHWEVTDAPDGVNPDDFAFQGQGTGTLSLFLPLAGTYKVSLKVTNDQDIDSVATADSTVTINAVPSQRFLVELTWDDDENDQDLHLVNAALDETLCGEDDCYFGNDTPQWYTSSDEGEGANPALDIDDMDGLGPENINIDAPRASTYRIYVHYFSFSGAATTSTVKIWVDGEVAATYSRRMFPEEVWTVAEIDWESAGVATITPYPSDASGQVGQVDDFTQDECFGLDDWEF